MDILERDAARRMNSFPIQESKKAFKIKKGQLVCFIADADLFAVIKVFVRAFLESFRNRIGFLRHSETKDYMTGSLIIREEVDAPAINNRPFFCRNLL